MEGGGKVRHQRVVYLSQRENLQRRSLDEVGVSSLMLLRAPEFLIRIRCLIMDNAVIGPKCVLTGCIGKSFAI